MKACSTAPGVNCQIFKVGLTLVCLDRVSYCVGLGAGPSEDGFREWLHRHIMFSQLPFLWAQVEPLHREQGGDLERQLQLLIYASRCSRDRQVFWSSIDLPAEGASELFLQSVSEGEILLPGEASVVLLAGQAVADLKLARSARRPVSSPGSPVEVRPRRQRHHSPVHHPPPEKPRIVAAWKAVREMRVQLTGWLRNTGSRFTNRAGVSLPLPDVAAVKHDDHDAQALSEAQGRQVVSA